MKPGDIRRNNIKILEILGYIRCHQYKEPTFQKKQFDNHYMNLDVFKFHSSWDELIPIFTKFKNYNIENWYVIFNNISTRFLLGVTSNNIEMSYKALVDLINHKHFQK